MKFNRYLCMLGVLTAGLTRSVPSHADEPEPESLLKGNKANERNTDVASSGFEMPYHATPESKDATEIVISAGGLASAGNSRSIAVTSAGKFRLRRGSDQLGAAIAANYAESAIDKGQGLQTTVENFQGKLRYDRFLAGSFAVFDVSSNDAINPEKEYVGGSPLEPVIVFLTGSTTFLICSVFEVPSRGSTG